MTLSLTARPIVRQGDPLPLELHPQPSPSLQTGYTILFDVSDLKIDDKAVAHHPTAWQIANYQGHQGLMYVSSEHGGASSDFPVKVDGVITSQLSIGSHRIDATLHLYRYKEGDFDWNADGHLHPASSTSNATTQTSPPLLAMQDMNLSAAFAVCDNTHEPPLATTDGKLRDAVRSSITIQHFSTDKSQHVRIDVFFKNPPVPLNFIVQVQPSDRTTKPFTVSDATCDAQSSAGIDAYGDLPVGRSSTVDVIFQPDIATARQSTDASPIWGEDVVFRNVPITVKQTLYGP
jgi:hypothetical protein